MEQPNRPDVRVEIEAEAKTEQNLRRMPVIGNSRVTDRTEQDGIEVFPEKVDGAGGSVTPS